MIIRKIAALLCILFAGLACASEKLLTVGGNGTAGFSGDTGPALSASLNNPSGVALDASGNLLIADASNHRIRRIDTSTGVITTVAGTGASGFSGDSGLATAAQLNFPIGIAVSNGDIYIADTGNHRIRKISNGNISTVAGDGTPAFAGENQLATAASLNLPNGVFVDAGGNVYIADTANNRIRVVDGLTGIITTLAGTGTVGAMGDGSPANLAELNAPAAVALNSGGIAYIADTGNNKIRTIVAGNISTFAGNGTAALSGDGAAAAGASLSSPAGIAFDSSGNLLIADTGNHRIRKVDQLNTSISTVAGTSSGFGGDGGDPLQGALNGPAGIALDGSDNLYIADTINQRIRAVSMTIVIKIAINSTSALPAAPTVFAPITFTVSATQADSLPLFYSWDFGDSSAAATGLSVSHAYATPGTFNVVVTVTDNIQSVAASFSLTVTDLDGNSGGAGATNVSQGKTVTNPVDGTALSVPASDAGKLTFTGAAPSGVSGRANKQINFFIDDGVKTTTLKGLASVKHTFPVGGIYTTTTEVFDTITKTRTGVMRKSVAISDRELGQPKFQKPDVTDITSVKMKGKFVLGAKLTKDLVTFTGRFELPGGLDISKDLPITVSVANITDSSIVNKRGVGTPGPAGLVSGLKIKYPKVPKNNPILPRQQFATISWKVAGSSLRSRGADSEGIDKAVPNGQTKLGATLKVQVLVALAGETYERIVTVGFNVSKNGDFGTLQQRSGF